MELLGKLNGWNVVIDGGKVWLVNPITGHRVSFSAARAIVK